MQQDIQYQGPMLNGRYVFLSTLGDGHTSIVYKARDLRTDSFVAVKVIKTQYLFSDSKSRDAVNQEIEVMKMLDHKGIIKLLEHGEHGKFVGPTGTKDNLMYIVMEYSEGHTLFDLQYNYGKGLGEKYGRFLMNQLLDALEHMHGRGIIHRDLKPENIIVNNHMNVKLLDFGFSTNEGIEALTAYRGTKTYMAPEIKKGQTYDGTQIDVFSLGVVVFSMTHGLFPFMEARRSDNWYSMLVRGQTEKYFATIDKNNTLSAEFKDLVLSMFAEEGAMRPTIAQIREHPWMQMETEGSEIVREQMYFDITGQKLAPPSPLLEQEDFDSPTIVASTPRTSMA